MDSPIIGGFGPRPTALVTVCGLTEVAPIPRAMSPVSLTLTEGGAATWATALEHPSWDELIISPSSGTSLIIGPIICACVVLSSMFRECVAPFPHDFTMSYSIYEVIEGPMLSFTMESDIGTVALVLPGDSANSPAAVLYVLGHALELYGPEIYLSNLLL